MKYVNIKNTTSTLQQENEPINVMSKLDLFN